MWGCAELGLPVERMDIGGRFGGLDDPAFRAMNPHGLIPVLQEDDGRVVFESAAILRYLAGRHGVAPFWPEDPLVRAEIDMWAEWGKHTFGQAFTGPVFWAHWRTPAEQRREEAVARAIERFEALMAVVAGRVGAGGYMVGPDLSLADIWVGHVLFRYFTLDISRNPPAALEDYYARLCVRDAFRIHVMIDYSELKGVPG